MRTMKIRLDDTTDWGCQGSDWERAEYETQVAAAIVAAYPGADVTVQCLQIGKPRVVVESRDADGTLLMDDATTDREAEIEDRVLAIAADVWEAGDFWTAEAV